MSKSLIAALFVGIVAISYAPIIAVSGLLDKRPQPPAGSHSIGPKTAFEIKPAEGKRFVVYSGSPDAELQSGCEARVGLQYEVWVDPKRNLAWAYCDKR